MGNTERMAHRFAFAVIFSMLAIVASAKLGSASESMPASNTNMDASYKMTTDVVPEIMIDENHPDHDNLVQAQEAAGSKTAGFWSTDWMQNYRIKALQDSNKALEDSTILQDNKIKALEDSTILQDNTINVVVLRDKVAALERIRLYDQQRAQIRLENSLKFERYMSEKRVKKLNLKITSVATYVSRLLNVSRSPP